MTNVATNLKTYFVPTTEHLEKVKYTLTWVEEYDQDAFNVIYNTSLHELSAKFRVFMEDILLPHRNVPHLKWYYKDSFSSKEEFLCHMGQISQSFFECDLGTFLRTVESKKQSSLSTLEAMELISYHFGITKYAFFCLFHDYKEEFDY